MFGFQKKTASLRGLESYCLSGWTLQYYSMMKRSITLLLMVLGWGTILWAQTGTITGEVRDAATQDALVGATVSIQALRMGANTDESGSYTISRVPAGTYEVQITYLGYSSNSNTVTMAAGETVTLDFAMEPGALVGQEVIISASRRPEKITNAPATVNVIKAEAIAELPSFNVGELAARQKGVDYVRSGVVGTGLNVRGFNSAFNPKNLQVNDYRLSSLIATGLPLGALSTVVKEDIERVEIILGPAAVLYGPNAHNGLVNTITKDPRDYEGTTIALGGGVEATGAETPAYVYSARGRHAMKVSDKFAYKITGEFTEGREFDYVDSVYTPFAPNGVAPELELNNDFHSYRAEGMMVYTPKPSHDLVLQAGHSNSSNLGPTNAGRNQIQDWTLTYLQARYQSPRLFAQVYGTWSGTDSTYAINQRTQNYYQLLANGFSEEEANELSYSSQYFPLSDTTGVFLPRGAIFEDASRRLNAEVQYNNNWGGLSLITGVQHQLDIANSNGTYLLDGGGDEPITINQVGGYAQAEYTIDNRIKFMAAARADYHQLYGFNFLPRAAALYITESGAFRVTYGRGIAAPTILNLEGNLFGGLLIGNGEGFTLTDGTEIAPLQVETINTFEVGYKGNLGNRVYLDVNGYFNISQNFLSPAINIANAGAGNFVTARGGVPMSEVIPGTSELGAPFVLTYVNFGRVNTYGADFGFQYALNQELSFRLNYSYFGFDLDEDDPANDGNRDGRVDVADLPINTPTHKLGLGLDYRKVMSNDRVFFANLFGRWVSAYDFFSGINVAAAENPDLTYNGSPVLEGARVGRDFNEGPLGGFFNLDVSAGYQVNRNLSFSLQVTNLLNAEVREFVAAPAIGRMVNAELKVYLGRN